MTLTINPAFRSLIPPLAPEELAQLEANILAEGCRDPLVAWNGVLVDGHNRYDICTKHGKRFEVLEKDFSSEDEAQVWVIRNQFGRRNLSDLSRVQLALKLEPLIRAKSKENQARKPESVRANLPRQKDTRATLAEIAGLSERTLDAGKLILERGDEETKEAVRTGKKSIHRAAKDIKDKIQKDNRAASRAQKAAGAKISDGLIVGDFSKNSDAVADGSVSLIFTDPPYDRAAESMFPALSEFASRKLADGGSLIMYLGHLQLPSAFRAFDGKLRHWWSCACLHGGEKALMREYGIRVGWKPMLWFVKGTRDDKSKIVFDTVTGTSEKSSHDWQQAQSEAEYYIENLCPADGIVCDPFLGGGTTAAAAKKLGRRWIAFEKDLFQSA